jgi:hypothetical protein
MAIRTKTNDVIARIAGTEPSLDGAIQFVGTYSTAPVLGSSIISAGNQ